GAGYANGRFAMDINAIWAPHALASIDGMLAALRTLGFSQASLDSLAPDIARTPLGTYAADPDAARRAAAVWQGAAHHFLVVRGREVNLFLLGVARQIAAAYDAAGRLKDPSLAPYVQSLRDALHRVADAVDASGFKHSELWSYRVEQGRLIPVRYGTGSDVQ